MSSIEHGKRRLMGLAVAGGALASLRLRPAMAQAEWRPATVVRLINGFSPGGSADQLCRVLAQPLAARLGQPVIVETRTGSGGFVAASAVARSAADGHTLGLATMGMLTISSQLRGLSLPLDVQKDLTPICGVAGIYSLLVASPQAPFRDVPELIAYAKANPGKLSYASTGIGSAPNLAAELFRSQAGVNIVHIPYKGGSQAVVDLIAGRVDMLIGNLPDFLPQVRGGQIRPIAFAGERAAPELPGVPLIKQWLPGYSVTNWFGIVAPAGLKPDVLQAWSQALQQVLAEPDTRNRMTELGMEIMGGSPQAFLERIDQDRERWSAVIKSANITLE